MNSKRLIFIVLGTILVLIFLVLLSSCKTIEEGEVGVLTVLGRYRGTLYPGTTLQLPLVSKIQRYPVGIRTYATMTQPELGSEDYKDVSISMNTSDQVQAAINYTIQFRLNPAMAEEVYRNYGKYDNAVEQVIKIPSRVIVREEVNKLKADKILTGIFEISNLVEEELRPLMEDAGFELVFFGFRDPNLGDYEEAKNAAMVQEQLSLVEQQKIAIAQYQAEQAIATAQGQKQITVIEAEAAAESLLAREKSIADADLYAASQKAEALVLLAQAEQEANRLVAASLSDQLIRYIQANGWSGNFPDTLIYGQGDIPQLLLPLGD